MYAAFVRFIRRRIVLGTIFVFSLTYCIVNLINQDSMSKLSKDKDIVIEQKLFVWRSLQEHNDTSEIKCRNSVQGREIIVDDRGYVCRRNDVMSNRCCDISLNTSSLHNCTSCDKKHCCAIYEHCVSCCLDPNKRSILEIVLSKLSSDDSALYGSLTNEFDLCLVKCRTSSHSVQHENSYKHPTLKYCFSNYSPGDPD